MKYAIALFALVMSLVLMPIARGADAKEKALRGVIASVSEPDAKGLITLTVMDGSRTDKHVVTITVDSNTKITEKKKTLTATALQVREQVNVVGETPATQIEILARKVRVAGL